MKPRRFRLAAVVGVAAVLFGPAPAHAQDGKAVYDSACAACHAVGVLGAPKPGDAAAWAPRAKKGIEGLLKSAINGLGTGMPPRGGRADLSDAQLRAAIHFMAGGAIATATANAAPPARPAAPAARAAPAAATPAPPAASPPTATSPATPASPATATGPTTPAVPADAAAAATVAPAPAPTAARPGGAAAAAAEVNAFNRLLRPLSRVNRPAVESGIHDPSNDMTLQLQPPAQAFATLPKSLAGNHVDWVKALDTKGIAPRWDRLDAAVPAVVMDLNIVREVKGSMPDVVYPHKQHTEWLDCANCHPAIFKPQKGANQISMASILLGQQCGVCHGKVAFPVSECRLCHSRKKAVATVAGESRP
jgi:c(7)-type cytochrome triheme protein